MSVVAIWVSQTLPFLVIENTEVDLPFLKGSSLCDCWSLVSEKAVDSANLVFASCFVVVVSEHLATLVHEPLDVHCLHSPCLPSSFLCAGHTGIALSLTRTTSFFLSDECFRLLIFQDVSDQRFQLCMTSSVLCDELDPNMIERQGCLHERQLFQFVGWIYTFRLHHHQCLLARLNISCRCATQCSASGSSRWLSHVHR